MSPLAVIAPREYRRPLHRYLLRRLRDPSQVDDLAQEVWLRLIRTDETRPIEKPLAYIYGIASHVLADWRVDREHQERRITFDSDIAEDQVESGGCFVCDDMAECLDMQRQLSRALALLPPKHREVLIAHKGDGMSYEEAGAALGLSVNTVAKYVTQAKSRVRTMEWER